MLDYNNQNLTYTKALVPSEFTDLLGIGAESYCRYLWSKKINKKATSAWQAIGQRQSGKPVTSLLDFKLKAEAFVPARGQRLCSVDVFVSPNEFFDWRNTKQLAQLHANWIEIDTVNHQILSLEEQNIVFAEVQDAIVKKGLPAPTGYVESGSGGLHLYWIYAGVPAYKWRVRIWREITLVLAKSLKSQVTSKSLWRVDFSASRDPSRVLRLPGTFHGVSGRVATAFTGGPVYSFDTLANALISSQTNVEALNASRSGKLVDVKPTLSNQKFTHRQKTSKPPETNTFGPRRHTIGQWWFRIYSEVCLHARGKGISEGQRDLCAFILYVALSHIKTSKDAALQATLDLNKEFIHLDSEELKSYLKTAHSKHYKFRKETIAEYLEINLEIPSDFLYRDQKSPPLDPHQIRQAQKDSAESTARKKREKTLSAITKAFNSLGKTRLNVTQEAVAALSGRSVRTVRRYWKDIHNPQGPLGLPLYIPAPGVLAG